MKQSRQQQPDTPATEQPDDSNVIWRPCTEIQYLVITCTVEEMFYAGARGSGKTDCFCVIAIRHCLEIKGANVVFCRQSYTESEDLIKRLNELALPFGAIYNQTMKRFRFDNGSAISIDYVQTIKDAQKGQGGDRTMIIFDEAGKYPTPDPIDLIRGSLRSTRGIKPRMLLGANPGGPGHAWLKERYVDPYPEGFKRMPLIKNGEKMDSDFIYIPARLDDNKLLLDRDPGYKARLRSSGPPWLVNAWLNGDWDISSGSFFATSSATRRT